VAATPFLYDIILLKMYKKFNKTGGKEMVKKAMLY